MNTHASGKHTLAVGAFIVMLTLWWGVPASACGATPVDAVEAVTKPSRDVTVSFVRSGQIAEIHVRQGQYVQTGQPIARQDDLAEQIHLARLEAQAGDTTLVEVAQAQLKQKKIDLNKVSEAARHGAGTQVEVEYAQLGVTVAKLDLRLARLSHQQDIRSYREVQARTDRMKLSSPLTGTVEKVLVEPGQAVDALDPVIRIISIDPLWIDVTVPLAQAVGLRRGRSVLITSRRRDAKDAAGRIVCVSSLADAASGTLMVRIELANPDRRPAGERVFVTFPEHQSADKAPAEPTADKAPDTDTTTRRPGEDEKKSASAGTDRPTTATPNARDCHGALAAVAAKPAPRDSAPTERPER